MSPNNHASRDAAYRTRYLASSTFRRAQRRSAIRFTLASSAFVALSALIIAAGLWALAQLPLDFN